MEAIKAFFRTAQDAVTKNLRVVVVAYPYTAGVILVTGFALGAILL